MLVGARWPNGRATRSYKFSVKFRDGPASTRPENIALTPDVFRRPSTDSITTRVDYEIAIMDVFSRILLLSLFPLLTLVAVMNTRAIPYPARGEQKPLESNKKIRGREIYDTR